MSYRPDNQSINRPATKIVEGIEEMESAVMERIRARDWQASHITDLKAMMLELNRIKYSLATLAEETW